MPQVLGEWAVTAEGGPVAAPLQGRVGFPQLLELFKGDTSTRAVCAACVLFLTRIQEPRRFPKAWLRDGGGDAHLPWPETSELSG